MEISGRPYHDELTQPALRASVGLVLDYRADDEPTFRAHGDNLVGEADADHARLQGLAALLSELRPQRVPPRPAASP